jgi:phenylacetate-CoA ligase
MAEAIAGASECDLGKLHVDEDIAVTEFVPTMDDSGYRIIGTAFTNPAFAFLRYDVGDIVSLADEGCSCGRPGRIIERIDGRKEDYVILKNGSRIGRMDHVFKDMVNIREAQIFQKQIGKIVLRVVPGFNFTDADEITLLQEVRIRVGNDEEIFIEYLDSLERSPHGKLRFVVSEVEFSKLEKIHLSNEA